MGKYPKIKNRHQITLFHKILLSFCQIYFTENECYLWTALTPNFVKRIQRDLEWEVMNILRAHYPSPYMLEWVDSASGEWNPPNL